MYIYIFKLSIYDNMFKIFKLANFILLSCFQDGNLNGLFSTDRVMIDRDGGQIVFQPLIQEDKGYYECRAFNDVGNDSVTNFFNVVGQDRTYDEIINKAIDY